MGIQTFTFCILMALLLPALVQAQLHFPSSLRLTYGQTKNYDFFDEFVAQGVPERALKRTLDYFNQIGGGKYKVPANPGETHLAKLENDKFVVIVDYSKISTEKRFFVLNLKTGVVEKYLVAHGLNSGGTKLYRTSNIPDSLQTSLGFYITGAEYMGQNGQSLKLYGLEKSNDKAFARAIVVHGSSYVSPEFMNTYGRIGRSHGCLTLEKSVARELIPRMKSGTLIFAYHESLSDQAAKNPKYQSTIDQNPKKDNPEPTRAELSQKPQNL